MIINNVVDLDYLIISFLWNFLYDLLKFIKNNQLVSFILNLERHSMKSNILPKMMFFLINLRNS